MRSVLRYLILILSTALVVFLIYQIGKLFIMLNNDSGIQPVPSLKYAFVLAIALIATGIPSILHQLSVLRKITPKYKAMHIGFAICNIITGLAAYTRYNQIMNGEQGRQTRELFEEHSYVIYLIWTLFFIGGYFLLDGYLRKESIDED